MYYNEKRKAITAKYVKTHLDDIKIRVPKGQREKLKSIASEMGMSMNQSCLMTAWKITFLWEQRKMQKISLKWFAWMRK